jgi:hypothetical protein
VYRVRVANQALADAFISEAVRVHIVAQSLDLFSRIVEICYCSAARIYTTHVS